MYRYEMLCMICSISSEIKDTLEFLPARASEQGNWRASEASETLFSHV